MATLRLPYGIGCLYLSESPEFLVMLTFYSVPARHYLRLERPTRVAEVQRAPQSTRGEGPYVENFYKYTS